MNCRNCSNFNKCKNNKDVGRCKFANKRSVSILTLKVRNTLEKILGKEAQYIILAEEQICPFVLIAEEIKI
jgi:hypothetical protein